MNIFILDSDIKANARAHCDAHVGKMILESGQLLSTAHRLLDDTPPHDSIIYKATHANHPCAVWVRASASNYDYAYRLFCALADEFVYRRGKPHATHKKLADALASPPRSIPRGGLTPFALAMPENCIVPHDAVASYRQYYITHKQHIAHWNWRRPKPAWWQVLPDATAAP